MKFYKLKSETTKEQMQKLGFEPFDNDWLYMKPNPTPFFREEMIIVYSDLRIRIGASMNTANERNLAFMIEAGVVDEYPTFEKWVEKGKNE